MRDAVRGGVVVELSPLCFIVAAVSDDRQAQHIVRLMQRRMLLLQRFFRGEHCGQRVDLCADQCGSPIGDRLRFGNNCGNAVADEADMAGK